MPRSVKVRSAFHLDRLTHLLGVGHTNHDGTYNHLVIQDSYKFHNMKVIYMGGAIQFAVNLKDTWGHVRTEITSTDTLERGIEVRPFGERIGESHGERERVRL